MTDTMKPDHLPDKEHENYLKQALTYIPFLETSLLMLALYQLNFATGGAVGWLKLGLFGIAAYAISYLIYRLSIERGATLYSVGYKTAGALSGVSVLAVSLSFFIATSAGLVVAPVEETRLGSHVKAQEFYVDAREANASKAQKLVPIINSVADDLQSKTDGEIASSSVSGRGSGGYGTTARTLENLAVRARGIANEVSEGIENASNVRQSLDEQLVRMDETLGDESVTIWERRTKLRKQDGALGGLLNQLDAAAPTSLLVAYVQELKAGVDIANRPAVSDTINRFMAAYAASLENGLAQSEQVELERPVFPKRTGALDTFEHAADFAPVFLLAFLIDLVFPISLWAYTIWGLDWGRYQGNPDPNRGKRRRNDFDELTEMQAIDLDEVRQKNVYREDARLAHGNRHGDNPPLNRPSHRSETSKNEV